MRTIGEFLKDQMNLNGGYKQASKSQTAYKELNDVQQCEFLKGSVHARINDMLSLFQYHLEMLNSICSKPENAFPYDINSIHASFRFSLSQVFRKEYLEKLLDDDSPDSVHKMSEQFIVFEKFLYFMNDSLLRSQIQFYMFYLMGGFENYLQLFRWLRNIVTLKKQQLFSDDQLISFVYFYSRVCSSFISYLKEITSICKGGKDNGFNFLNLEETFGNAKNFCISLFIDLCQTVILENEGNPFIEFSETKYLPMLSIIKYVITSSLQGFETCFFINGEAKDKNGSAPDQNGNIISPVFQVENELPKESWINIESKIRQGSEEEFKRCLTTVNTKALKWVFEALSANKITFKTFKEIFNEVWKLQSKEFDSLINANFTSILKVQFNEILTALENVNIGENSLNEDCQLEVLNTRIVSFLNLIELFEFQLVRNLQAEEFTTLFTLDFNQLIQDSIQILQKLVTSMSTPTTLQRKLFYQVQSLISMAFQFSFIFGEISLKNESNSSQNDIQHFNLSEQLLNLANSLQLNQQTEKNDNKYRILSQLIFISLSILTKSVQTSQIAEIEKKELQRRVRYIVSNFMISASSINYDERNIQDPLILRLSYFSLTMIKYNEERFEQHIKHSIFQNLLYSEMSEEQKGAKVKQIQNSSFIFQYHRISEEDKRVFNKVVMKLLKFKADYSSLNELYLDSAQLKEFSEEELGLYRAQTLQFNEHCFNSNSEEREKLILTSQNTLKLKFEILDKVAVEEFKEFIEFTKSDIGLYNKHLLENSKNDLKIRKMTKPWDLSTLLISLMGLHPSLLMIFERKKYISWVINEFVIQRIKYSTAAQEDQQSTSANLLSKIPFTQICMNLNDLSGYNELLTLHEKVVKKDLRDGILQNCLDMLQKLWLNDQKQLSERDNFRLVGLLLIVNCLINQKVNQSISVAHPCPMSVYLLSMRQFLDYRTNGEKQVTVLDLMFDLLNFKTKSEPMAKTQAHYIWSIFRAVSRYQNFLMTSNPEANLTSEDHLHSNSQSDNIKRIDLNLMPEDEDIYIPPKIMRSNHRGGRDYSDQEAEVDNSELTKALFFLGMSKLEENRHIKKVFEQSLKYSLHTQLNGVQTQSSLLVYEVRRVHKSTIFSNLRSLAKGLKGNKTMTEIFGIQKQTESFLLFTNPISYGYKSMFSNDSSVNYQEFRNLLESKQIESEKQTEKDFPKLINQQEGVEKCNVLSQEDRKAYITASSYPFQIFSARDIAHYLSVIQKQPSILISVELCQKNILLLLANIINKGSNSKQDVRTLLYFVKFACCKESRMLISDYFLQAVLCIILNSAISLQFNQKLKQGQFSPAQLISIFVFLLKLIGDEEPLLKDAILNNYLGIRTPENINTLLESLLSASVLPFETIHPPMRKYYTFKEILTILALTPLENLSLPIQSLIVFTLEVFPADLIQNFDLDLEFIESLLKICDQVKEGRILGITMNFLFILAQSSKQNFSNLKSGLTSGLSSSLSELNEALMMIPPMIDQQKLELIPSSSFNQDEMGSSEVFNGLDSLNQEERVNKIKFSKRELKVLNSQLNMKQVAQNVLNRLKNISKLKKIFENKKYNDTVAVIEEKWNEFFEEVYNPVDLNEFIVSLTTVIKIMFYSPIESKEMKDIKENLILIFRCAFSFFDPELAAHMERKENQEYKDTSDSEKEKRIIKKLDKGNTQLKYYFMFKESLEQNDRLEQLNMFCIKNLRMINKLLENNKIIIYKECSLTEVLPNLVDFKNKKAQFYKLLESRELHGLGHCDLQIIRSDLFNSTFIEMKELSSEEFNKKLKVRFLGEGGIDAGGLKKDFFTDLSKEIFKDEMQLFKQTSNTSTYYPNTKSQGDEKCLDYYKFVGRILGKALQEKCLLDCYFAKPFYKIIIGEMLDLKDMEAFDNQLYESFKWMTTNDIEGMDLRFVVENQQSETGVEIELVEGGHSIAVTNATKFEYLELMIRYKLYDCVKQHFQALLEGFHQLIPKNLVKIFTANQLELLISGLPSYDCITIHRQMNIVNDLRENTNFRDYNVDSPQIVWLFEILETFENHEKAEFLQFVTGSSKVPVEGFKGLVGMGGVRKFSVVRVNAGNPPRFPVGHTCFNQLDLPAYDSKEVMQEKLMMAIKEKSFGMA